MLQTYTFQSGQPGPHLLVLGAIHGNEPCGTYAIHHVADLFHSGELQLLQGSVTMVPVCNPKAFAHNKRYIDHNLNRMFGVSPQDAYESSLVPELQTLIKQSDMLIDLHSGPGLPEGFIFHDYDHPIIEQLIHHSQIKLVVSGRNLLYDDQGIYDTIGYAHSLGIPGVCIECGDHNQWSSIQQGINSVLGMMSGCGMIDVNIHKIEQTKIMITDVIYKQKEGLFIKPRVNAQCVKKGEIIGTYYDGSVEIAPYSGYILLPHEGTTVGAERFYLGVGL